MNRLKKVIYKVLILASILYVFGCGYLYFQQENLIFKPIKLKVNDEFKFEIPFKEFNIETSDKVKLNCLLFKNTNSKPSKGLIFFLHGNSGSLQDIAGPAEFYSKMGYDFFSMDYRGFGKSSGEIISEKQFFDDVELVYGKMKMKYKEENISIFGYSLGTCSAAMLASKNNPSKLILFAPYFSMIDMALNRYKILPTFLLNYKFETNKYVVKTKSPIIIFHGEEDKGIPFDSSTRLSVLLKKEDKFIPLKKQGHNGFENNQKFVKTINEIL